MVYIKWRNISKKTKHKNNYETDNSDQMYI
jgi:hypothetical protein